MIKWQERLKQMIEKQEAEKVSFEGRPPAKNQLVTVAQVLMQDPGAQKRFTESKGKGNNFTTADVQRIAITFAKAKVKEALAAVDQELYIRTDFEWSIDESAYPLNNIK